MPKKLNQEAKKELKDFIHTSRNSLIEADKRIKKKLISLGRKERIPPVKQTTGRTFVLVYYPLSHTHKTHSSAKLNLSNEQEGEQVCVPFKSFKENGGWFDGFIVKFDSEKLYLEKNAVELVKDFNGKGMIILPHQKFCIIFCEGDADIVDTRELRGTPELFLLADVEVFYAATKEKKNGWLAAKIIGFATTYDEADHNIDDIYSKYTGEGGDEGGDDGDDGSDGDEANAGGDETDGDTVPHESQPLAPVAPLIADPIESRDEEMGEEEAEEGRQEEVAMEVAEGAEAREMEANTGDDFDSDFDLPSLEEDNQSGDVSILVNMDDEDLPDDVEDEFALPVEKEKKDADMF